MSRAKWAKRAAGWGTGSAAREGIERSELDIPESVMNTLDAASLGSILSPAVKWAYNKLPDSYKKKVTLPAFTKVLKNKLTSKKALAKRGAKMAGSALSGPFAPAVGLGFLGHDIYDIGKSLYNLYDIDDGEQKVTGRKKGGQVKKTKRKVRSKARGKARGKPRGVGKALRGYGAVSR